MMVVGTDIRLMTPIMTETLLNAEMLAINQVSWLVGYHAADVQE